MTTTATASPLVRRLVVEGAIYLGAVVLASLVSALFIVAMRGDVLVAFRTIVVSSLGSVGGIAQSLNKLSPLLLGGVAVMLGLRGGFVNIGVDGQIYAGAILTTAVAFSLASSNFPALVLVPVVLAAGAVGGGIFGAIPGVLRARWGVNEIFVTVMLNFVAYYLTDYLSTGPWNDATSGEAITLPIPAAANLPMLVPTGGAHAGIVIALVVAVLVSLLLTRTVVGYEIRAVGANPRAAVAGGISIPRITLITLTVGGALGGLAGAIEVSGYHNRLILGLTPGYGAMAILISVLGHNRPVGVGVAAAAVAALMVGADSLQRSVKLPASAGFVFQAIVVLCVLLVEARSARRRTS